MDHPRRDPIRCANRIRASGSPPVRSASGAVTAGSGSPSAAATSRAESERSSGSSRMVAAPSIGSPERVVTMAREAPARGNNCATCSGPVALSRMSSTGLRESTW